jgi:hypothetical protein
MPSNDESDAAYLSLLAGLWAEMEDVLRCYYAGAAAGEGAPERAACGIEALLLELALLGDESDSLRRRGLITPEQADRLRALIEELRVLIDFEPFGVALPRAGVAIVRAQNRLFDELQRVAPATAPLEAQRLT